MPGFSGPRSGLWSVEVPPMREARGVANREPDKYGSARSGVARGLSLAFEFAGAVFLFWFLGRLVDGWLGTEPWAQIVGSLLGWAGGTLHVYYAVQRRN